MFCFPTSKCKMGYSKEFEVLNEEEGGGEGRGLV